MTFPEDHTGSYYAATINDPVDYPVLDGDLEADICVIGAGFTGIATALTLSERGFKVAVVEANRVGWGASGRNGGQVIAGISGESRMVAKQKQLGKDISKMMWDMSWRGNEIIRNRVETYQINCDLTWGYIDVASKQAHMDDFRDMYEELEQHDHPHDYRMVERDEIASVVGTDQYIGGIITMGNGHIHPLNLCLGEARAAVNLGAQIFERSPVTDITHGSKPIVHTDKGRVTANTVIMAGGAYHTLERKKLGGLLFPAGSYIIATEPLGEDLAKEINPLNLAICEASHILDYYRLSADTRMLYGGRCNYSGRDPKSIKATMQPRLLKVYPQLAGKQIDYEWGGKIGIIINRVPMLGKLSDNVYYAQGYSGHGVNVTHLVGEIMADAIAGSMERFDVFNQVKHIPVPGGQWFGNQMVALGMIYYRMLDLL